MSNQPQNPSNSNKQDPSRNSQSQAQPDQKDKYSSQGATDQKSGQSSFQSGNEGSMKNEGKGKDGCSSSSADDKSQQAPRKSSNA